MITDIEIRCDGQREYTLVVNGIPTIKRESFSMVDRVADELRNPGCYFPSEATEVADSIRKSHEHRE